jgi:uncharacterized protein
VRSGDGAKALPTGPGGAPTLRISTDPGAADHGATAVITHRVPAAQHGAYEGWLDAILAACAAAPGHLDSQVVRPLAGRTETWTLVLRFASRDDLRGWLASDTRARLLGELTPLEVRMEEPRILSGLEFFFPPPGEAPRQPVRWKQYLLTWSAVYPLMLTVASSAFALLRRIGLPTPFPLVMFFVTALVVFLLVYVVMPPYTRLMRGWLFSRPAKAAPTTSRL